VYVTPVEGVFSVKGTARKFYGSSAKGESAMGYQEIQRKLNAVKRRLEELHQPLKIADENYEYYSGALAMHEDLIGPEMDASEMFFIEGQLDALERKLSKYH
jgi:hypothetical protein